MLKTAAQLVFKQLKLGEVISYKQKITAGMVNKFAELSGDYNPLHTNAAYAAGTEFKRPVAHGMLAGAFISGLLGMYLPGQYCLYLSQTLSFHKPIYFDTLIIVQGTVVQKVKALKLARIETKIINAKNNELLVSGEALVKLLK